MEETAKKEKILRKIKTLEDDICNNVEKLSSNLQLSHKSFLLPKNGEDNESYLKRIEFLSNQKIKKYGCA